MVTLFESKKGQDLRGFCEEACGQYCAGVRCLLGPFLMSVALTGPSIGNALPEVKPATTEEGSPRG